MSIFFPGDGSQPQTVSKANVYRASTTGVEMQFTGPKDDKQINIARARIWIVDVIFDKQINAEESLLIWSGLDSNMRLEQRDFTARSAVVTIVPNGSPVNENKPTEPINPKGLLELRVVKRTSFSQDMLTRPSPTPHTATSPH